MATNPNFSVDEIAFDLPAASSGDDEISDQLLLDLVISKCKEKGFKLNRDGDPVKSVRRPQQVQIAVSLGYNDDDVVEQDCGGWRNMNDDELNSMLEEKFEAFWAKKMASMKTIPQDSSKADSKAKSKAKSKANIKRKKSIAKPDIWLKTQCDAILEGLKKHGHKKNRFKAVKDDESLMHHFVARDAQRISSKFYRMVHMAEEKGPRVTMSESFVSKGNYHTLKALGRVIRGFVESGGEHEMSELEDDLKQALLAVQSEDVEDSEGESGYEIFL